VGRNLPRWDIVVIQHPGGAAMGGIALGRVQRRLDRVTDDWVREARRVVAGQHVASHEAHRHPQRIRHRHTGDGRGLAQLAAVAEHGECLRQAQRGGIVARYACEHQARDLLASAGEQRSGLERARRPVLAPHRPQKLGQVERVAAGGRPGGGRHLVAASLAQRGPDEHAGGAFAQQRRAQDCRCGRPQRRRRGLRGARLRRPCGDEQRQRQPLQPRREVGQPAQRGLIGPVGVVDRDQQRSARRQVGREPVQPVQDGERGVVVGRLRRLPQQQRPRGDRGPVQQRVGILRRRHAALEELPDDAEREARFELGPAGVHDVVPERVRPPARSPQERRLPRSRRSFDEQHLAAALQQTLDLRQLALALDQLVHD
jgi:hypothetical protein